MTPKCSICGKFCKIVDIGIPFGNCNDLEPPDEILFCQECVDREKAYHLEKKWMPNFWLKPNWVLDLAQELGYIEVAYKGCAWSFWHKRDESLKENMVIVQ